MLNTSFRMCEPICDYVSELFYDGHLHAMKHGCSNALICDNPLYSFDTPVVLHEIDDDGEQVSDKEAMFIADTIAGFIAKVLIRRTSLCCHHSVHKQQIFDG